MSHFGDYMDDVPVKISEKYKPPPKIELPYNINDSVSRANALIENVHYDFNFETNILAKLKELRRAKEIIKNERLHRLQLIKEAKQAELDRIAAAETEAKLKQLSVSEVSYPSTEEISEISLDESADRCSDNKNQLSSFDKCEVDEQKLQHVTSQTSYYDTYDSHVHANGQQGYSTRKDTFLQTESQPEILKPTPLLTNTCQPNLLDEPDPLREIQQNSSLFNTSQLRRFYKKNNIEKLTFSDFENDTSSPFDNMELKTINDFELLAQALESQKEQIAGNVSQVEYGMSNQQDLGYLPSTNFYPSNSVHSVSYNYNGHPIVNHVASTYSSPQAYISPNGYYHTPIETAQNCDNIPPASGTNLYMAAYGSYYTPSNACQNSQNIDTNFYNIPQNGLSYAIPPKNTGLNENFNTTQHSEPYQYFDYRQQNSNYNAYNNIITQPIGLENAISQQQIPQSAKENYSTITISSRSRSVPDIMKELDEEISSTRLKYNQRSSNSSPAPHDQPSRKQSASGIHEIKTVPKIVEQLPNPYETLSPELQKMCKNISSMGFPLSRVARVSLLTGENDKKIIECLLAVGQLMDLGFSEKQVVTALMKNDFNRDKALDDLVS